MLKMLLKSNPILNLKEMIMLKRTAFWLTLFLVSSLALPGWSLPKSLIMTMEISSKQGGQPIKANAQLWYANEKFRAEITSNMNTSGQGNTPVKIGNKATIVSDLKTKMAYLIDDASKTAIKIDQGQMAQMTGGAQSGPQSFTDPASLTDPAKLKAEIKKQGGKEVGKAKILGHTCTIWQMSGKTQVPMGQGKSETQNITSKVWLADAIGMPLKVEVTSDKMGAIVNMQATKVQVNVPVSNNMFGVPAGYQVRDLMDMYKQR